ncbi:MAG: C4-dicarboxylate ABC transporter substrate-binding protein [Hyphomicrobiales bacterium]|nr:MAG: C4-dicarboxylate ABC transporter substrate-binding protein [Hyphomicrobiales bacterium]
MQKILNTLDKISIILGGVAQFIVILLITSMIYEVVARYGFNQPTLWAFDISYMLNGTIFLLGAAYTLRNDAHVRIDFLSTKLSLRVQQWINGIFYMLILGPIFTTFGYVASQKAWKAFITSEVESVSPWAPLVWPFYGVIAIGLLSFAIQFFIEAIRYLLKQNVPGDHHGELEVIEEFK